MKTKTMGNEIRHQYDRLVDRRITPVEKRTNEDWEFIYTLDNILNECGGFASTEKVVCGLKYLEFIYNHAVKNYDELVKDPMSRFSYMDRYNINLHETKKTLIKKLAQRVNTINFICEVYMTSKDNFKKFKLESA